MIKSHPGGPVKAKKPTEEQIIAEVGEANVGEGYIGLCGVGP